jgi:hypothetical protein
MGRRTLPAVLLLGALVGLALPLGELLLDCRRFDSEGCMWGRALLPVSLTAGALLGAAAAGLLLGLVRLVQGGARPHDDGA